MKALPGVIAASSGLVLSAAYLMLLPVAFNWIEPGDFFYTNLDMDKMINVVSLLVIAVTSVLLFTTKIKSPWYIVVAILLGVVIM